MANMRQNTSSFVVGFVYFYVCITFNVESLSFSLLNYKKNMEIIFRIIDFR